MSATSRRAQLLENSSEKDSTGSIVFAMPGIVRDGEREKKESSGENRKGNAQFIYIYIIFNNQL